MAKGKQIARRNYLFYRDPHCWKCGIFLSHPDVYKVKTPDGIDRLKKPAGHMAVLHHLDSKFSIERGQHCWEYRTILVCFDCDKWMCRLEQEQVPLEYKHIAASGVRAREVLQMNKIDAQIDSAEQELAKWKEARFYTRQINGHKYTVEEACMLGQSEWMCYCDGTLISMAQYSDAAMEICQDHAHANLKQRA